MSPPTRRSRPAGNGPATNVEKVTTNHDPASVAPPRTEDEFSAASAISGARHLKRRRRTNAELAELDTALVELVEAEQPMTLRGVYYRAVSASLVDKTEAAYRLVGRQVLKLRRGGVMPYRWITDGTRWISKPTSYHDADQALDILASSYRRALWAQQSVTVHVFTEKDAISGVIYPVTSRWDVPLAVLRGYCSESFAYTIGAELAADGRPAYCYGLGDHDPSGVDAWRDLQDKVHRFAPAADITFVRLAVTEEQLAGMVLPTRPTKRTDTRARGFLGESVEVDAIPPSALRQLVEEAITQHIDSRVLALTYAVETEERAGLEALAGAWAQ